MNDHPAKQTMDVVALVATTGTFLNLLPYMAAALSIVWTGLRIIEMMTGKPISELIKRRKK